MKFDYVSASTRHLFDARFLHEHGRNDNAAYLAGYVIECGLKAVIEIAGRPPKIHDLFALRGEALNLAADLSYAVRRYQVDLNADFVSSQNTWNVDLRYRSTGFVQANQAERLIESATQFYHNTIGAMFLDGLLERCPS